MLKSACWELFVLLQINAQRLVNEQNYVMTILSYVPFGPSEAVCQGKKNFWKVMPTLCVPQGFKAPKSWNVDDPNTYFNRAEEWDYILE